jgi:hypothetical protein
MRSLSCCPGLRALSSVAIGVLACSACQSADTSTELRRKPPAPWVVGVEWPTDQVAGPDFRLEGEPVATTRARVVDMLARELRALNASSHVVVPGESSPLEPDVILTFWPRGTIEMSHVGASSVLAAGGLWLVTWIGGLLVPDSTYAVTMDAACRYTTVGTNWSFEKELQSDTAALSFFERNDFFSGPTLQSLVLPPFWTSDQDDKTGAALSQAAMRIVARQITELMKTDFDELSQNDLKCSIRITSPVNGDPVASSTMLLSLDAASTEAPIKKVIAQVVGGPEVDVPLVERISNGRRARAELTGLRADTVNWVRITVTTGKGEEPHADDQRFTRTLRLGGAQ